MAPLLANSGTPIAMGDDCAARPQGCQRACARAKKSRRGRTDLLGRVAARSVAGHGGGRQEHGAVGETDSWQVSNGDAGGEDDERGRRWA